MSSETLYLDTSAWLKLYIQEGGSELVEQTINKSDQVCTHLIAYAELRAALARAERENRIKSEQKLQIIEANGSRLANIQCHSANGEIGSTGRLVM